MSTTIEDRFILILREQTTTQDEKEAEAEKSLWTHIQMWRNPPQLSRFGVWETLDNLTGIPAQSWRSAYNRRQKPTTQMIETMAHMWPQYAFWLVTGITDATNGHVAPTTALTFPERLYRHSYMSNAYFRKSIDLAKKLYAEGKVDSTDEKQRMFAAERTRPLAHWIASPLIETAYKLAQTEEYKELQKEWEAREVERTEDLDKVTGKHRPWKEKDKANGLKRTPILGIDPRSKHQDHWDIFYSNPPQTNPDETEKN